MTRLFFMAGLLLASVVATIREGVFEKYPEKNVVHLSHYTVRTNCSRAKIREDSPVIYQFPGVKDPNMLLP